MDFWRAYRVLQRRIWVILAAAIITTGVVSAGFLTIGKRFDASTGFGPTDQAVRNAVAAGVSDNKSFVLSDDARQEEVRRMARDVTAPDNCSRAIYYLANADGVRAEVTRGLSNTADVEKLSSDKEHDQVVSVVQSVIDKTPASQIKRFEEQFGIPSSLWGEFLYLDNKITASNVSRDFLRSDNLAGSVEDLRKIMEDGVAILNTRALTITVTDRDPAKAEILADALTAAYRHKYDEQSQSAAKSNVRYFSKQLEEGQKKFNVAQRRLREFRVANKDVFLPDQVAHAIKTNDGAKSQLDDLQETLSDLDKQIAAGQTRLTSIPRRITKAVTNEDPSIGALRERKTSLSAELAQKQGLYTDKNPEVARLREQLKSVEGQLAKVRNSTVTTRTTIDNDDWLAKEQELANLGQRRQGLAAREAVLRGVMSKQMQMLARLPEIQTQLDGFTRDYADTGTRLTDIQKSLSNAREELQQTAAKGSLINSFWAGTSNFSATHPEIPASRGATKRTVMGIVAALLISLIGSAGIILGMDLLDQTVRTPMDAERVLDSPVTGIVPRLPGANPLLMPQITHRLPSSVHAEAYRFLGTDILLTAHDAPFKTVMVATAKPNQGGTATICNLAITLAQAGQRVALVDADMRRPSLHEIFNLPNEMGLSNVLADGKLPSDVIQRTEIDNLMVLPGGPTPANAWKLLRSPKMRETIDDLARDFDFVLFDTPSAVVFADAATLATMLDGVLLVVRANEAPSGGEMQVRKLLNKTKIRIVGVVLNDMPVQQVDSARFYSSYYAPGTKTEIAEAVTTRHALPKPTADDEI